MIVDNRRSLPVVRVADIVTEESTPRWLIDQLWGASAVGVIGGAPKCSKTWLALDMSLSVATGTACLDRYEVPQPGPVLIYLAEDSLAIVRERVEGIARHRGLQLDAVPLHVITAPVLQLDREPHRTQLLETARQLRPRLLLLDPLVRLHGIDENHAGEGQVVGETGGAGDLGPAVDPPERLADDVLRFADFGCFGLLGLDRFCHGASGAGLYRRGRGRVRGHGRERCQRPRAVGGQLWSKRPVSAPADRFPRGSSVGMGLSRVVRFAHTSAGAETGRFDWRGRIGSVLLRLKRPPFAAAEV